MRNELRIYRLVNKIMTISDDIRYSDAFDAAKRYYANKPILYGLMVHVDTDFVASEYAKKLKYNGKELDDEQYLYENLSVEVGEYMYYLKTALIKNLIPGVRYSIMRKKNNRVCIYIEDKRWVVSKVKNNTPVCPQYFEYICIWPAVFAFIDMLTKDESKRKKIQIDFGTDANWAEKMAEPQIIRVEEIDARLTPEGKARIAKADED